MEFLKVPFVVHYNLPHITFTSPVAAAAKSLQSCPTLCDPTDGSPPGSPVPGILQAKTLEWGAITFSVTPPSLSQMLRSFPSLPFQNHHMGLIYSINTFQ